MMQVESVEQLERNRRDEDDEHESVGPETRAPQVNGQRQHQDCRQLDAAQLRDQLEEWMERGLPGIVGGQRDLEVEVRERAGRDRDRESDEDHAQRADRNESRN